MADDGAMVTRIRWGRARPAVRVLPALAVLTAVLGLAACGGAKASTEAPDDAKAACAALVRTKANFTRPGDADWRRLRAAGDLGVAAATENTKKYGELNQPFAVVYKDALNSDSTSILTDARAALSVCADLDLPH
jgi:predicted small lipoprotein YifL